MNWNLYKKKNNPLHQAWICESFDERMRWYSGIRVKKTDWDNGLKAASLSSIKAEKEKAESIYREIKKQLAIQNKLTAHNVKFLLDCKEIHNAENYIDAIKAWIPRIETKQEFLEAFQLFIDHSVSGERTTDKRKKISKWTIKKYNVVLNLLKKFSKETGYSLSWKNINDDFYTKLTNYCWYTLDHYDNHVGTMLTSIRAFLNWADKKNIIPNKLYDETWVVWKEEETDALALYPDEIQALYEMPIDDQGLSDVRDNYILGCMTCLRSANLLALEESDLSIVGSSWSINIVQAKNDKPLSIKLHTIAIDIIKKNLGRHKTLLPYMTYLSYNLRLKDVAKLFKAHLEKEENKQLIVNEWDKPFTRIRYKQGKPIKVEMDICNMLTPHTQRSTGITNLLIMGMLEYEVKKISGHAKASKSFGKYVRIAQRFIDSKSDEVWDKIFANKSKVLKKVS
jgi:integrase